MKIELKNYYFMDNDYNIFLIYSIDNEYITICRVYNNNTFQYEYKKCSNNSFYIKNIQTELDREYQKKANEIKEKFKNHINKQIKIKFDNLIIKIKNFCKCENFISDIEIIEKIKLICDERLLEKIL